MLQTLPSRGRPEESRLLELPGPGEKVRRRQQRSSQRESTGCRARLRRECACGRQDRWRSSAWPAQQMRERQSEDQRKSRPDHNDVRGDRKAGDRTRRAHQRLGQ